MGKIEEELKDKVLRLRKSAGLTQVALANLANLSPKMIKDIEKGRRRGSVETLVSLANAFDIKLEDLINDAPEAKPRSIESFKIGKIVKHLESIPDEIYVLAAQIDPKNKIWKAIKDILEDEIEYGPGKSKEVKGHSS